MADNPEMPDVGAEHECLELHVVIMVAQTVEKNFL